MLARSNVGGLLGFACKPYDDPQRALELAFRCGAAADVCRGTAYEDAEGAQLQRQKNDNAHAQGAPRRAAVAAGASLLR